MSTNKPTPRNHPYLEKAVVALWYVEEACADFLEDHEDSEHGACDCFQCEDVQSILWTVRHCEAALTSQMRGMPPSLRRLRALGFPEAETFAELVTSMGQGDDAGTSDQE